MKLTEESERFVRVVFLLINHYSEELLKGEYSNTFNCIKLNKTFINGSYLRVIEMI